MNSPTLSVVIPTYGRANWIDLAIDSCLAIADLETKVEILVCANGTDPSSIPELKKWASHPSIRILFTAQKGANPARNLGLRQSQGRYVIFLDDDDHLVSENVKEQLRIIAECGADVCSGNALVIGETGDLIKKMNQCSHQDMATSSLSGELLALNFTHCYKRDFLGDATWDESYPAGQDHKFIYDLVSAKEVNWQKINHEVGCWRWHGAPRISTTQLMNRFFHHAQATRAAVEKIRFRGALSETRSKAAARNIWNNIHAIFEQDLRWSVEMAKFALALDPRARPETGRPWLQPLVDKWPIGTEVAYSTMRLLSKWIQHPKKFINR